jgi:hypothetical protein
MPKKYTVKDGETLGIIADKFGMPSWKYLYQLNKDVIGANPDVLKAGIVLKIPVIEESLGYQLLRDKGVNPDDYIGGTRYKYPWVPVSFTIANPDGTVYKEFDEKGNERTEFAKKKKYEIKNADNGNVLVTGEISKSEEISVLVPDVKRKLLIVDGVEYQLWKEEKK